ncbi:hypothetical protein [Chamaesiphon polymorphus]|uniref:ATP-grasp fold RimK-type domain-containing protein n=1 Tax=Chamaesiphon polymorphus CCALA 037 TaxID=2107692 RepID=A0A2T1F4G2_9CYAN|nr:hypothetical protein [Chamaesiphon polymorphus]PSB39880.1 hypothetical protein C7B77_28910 [Chamaesiphon polymorphus CCALA 037]
MAVTQRVCIVGLEEHEVSEIQSALEFGIGIVAHQALPQIVVRDGKLLVASRQKPGLVEVTRVVFHGIYEDDLEFLAALALWGGSCLPSPRGMMDLRLRLPGLVRALEHTRFGLPLRGYASPKAEYHTETERVAKWGNWHCGKNKERFEGIWQSEDPCIVEAFIPGQSVRIVLIGDKYWQIKLEGDSWLKSIHAPNANFMEIDRELLADTKNIAKAFGLELIANDYIVTDRGTKHLLEVNHVPNVSRFPEIWAAYRDYTTAWINRSVLTVI